MRKNLKRQFSFVYWVGYKDGLVTLIVLTAIILIIMGITKIL